MSAPSILTPALMLALTLSACRADITLPAGSAALRVAGAGTGSGTVSAVPEAQPKFQCEIEAGTAAPTSCRGVYAVGTAMSLTASPSAGSRFVGWADACSGSALCQFALADSAQVIATFQLAQHTLVVVGAGTGSGSVKSPSGSAPAINCTITGGQGSASGCAGTFLESGGRLALTAAATSSSTFSGWGGSCSGTATCSVALDQDRVVSAAFIPRAR